MAKSLRNCLELAGVFGTSGHAQSIVARARNYIQQDGYDPERAEQTAVQDHIDQVNRQLDSVYEQAGVSRKAEGGTPKAEGAMMREEPPKAQPGEAPPWVELQNKKRTAEDDLQRAIRLVGNPTERSAAGLTKDAAQAQKVQATAALRQAQDELRNSPSYVEHLMNRTKEIQQALKANPDEQAKAELQSEFEVLNHELSEAPKKLVSAVYNARFAHGAEQTAREKQAGSEAPGTQGKAEVGDVTGEVSPESQAQRIKAAVANFPEGLRSAKASAVHSTGKLAALWSARENRDAMAAGYDGAKTAAQLFGRQAAGEVLHGLNRNFGATGPRVTARNPTREAALSFVIESGMDEAELADQRAAIVNSEFANRKVAKDAVKAMDFALTHWERLKPMAELYGQVTDAQVEHENAAGVETLHRSGGYVLHLTDVMAQQALPDIGGTGGGQATPFLKTRVHSTFADAIAAGEMPKSLNAVDLLQKRMTMGQELINHGAWIDGMFRLKDPKSELPIVTHTITKTRADGKNYEEAPPGYVKITDGPQTFAMLRGYDGLFKSLTTPSTIRNSLAGNVAMELAGGIKHSMLVFDTYHFGRMAFWNAMVRGTVLPGNPFAHGRGLALLDNTVPELERMAAGGEIPKEWLEDLKESKRQLAGLVRHGLNVGSVADNIATHFVEQIPVAGRFNKFLFQKFQRGATAAAGLIELRRQIHANPGIAEDVLMRSVASKLNTRFGNLQSQSWIKNKNVGDILRIMFLAPQWNEGLIRSEIGAVGDIGKAPFKSWKTGRINIGLLGRAAAMAVIGQFLMNQIINWITRGQPTWENPEEGHEAKLSAWIPDLIGNSAGYWLNPLTLPAEMSDLIAKKTDRTGDITQALKQVLASRLGPLGRQPYTLAVREDSMGAKLRTSGEVMGQMASSLVPVPISAGAVVRAGKQLVTGEPEEKYPGQFERQLFQTFGQKLDSAPTPDQRIKALAKEFNREKGVVPGAEFYHSDYHDLDNAAIVGNKTEMAKALADLLQKKTKEDIKKHYDRWTTAPYTGQQAREMEFLRTLDPEQRAAVATARAKRRALRDSIMALVR